MTDSKSKILTFSNILHIFPKSYSYPFSVGGGKQSQERAVFQRKLKKKKKNF